MKRRIGGELELALVNSDATAHDPRVGRSLVQAHARNGILTADPVTGEPDYVSLDTPWGPARYGYDATWCTAEGALPVVSTLHEMDDAIEAYAGEVRNIIGPQGGRIFGGGMQPKTSPTVENYRRQVRDRAVYMAITDVSWRGGRENFPFHYNWGHRHTAFTAHHSPWIDVAPDEAPDALAVAHAFRGIIYLLFASSPILGAQVQDSRDYRPLAWQRFMTAPRIAQHRNMIGGMSYRPRSVEDVLRVHWQDQPMWFLPANDGGTYKGGLVDFVGPQGIAPDFMTFLRSEKSWPTLDLSGRQKVLTPSTQLMSSAADWWAFWTRWRFLLNPEAFELQEFLEAYDHGEISRLLSRPGVIRMSAIEWRDFSAQPQEDIMAAWACALGWIENLSGAVALLNQLSWEGWLSMAELALTHGFQAQLGDVSLVSLADQALEVAYEGLRSRGLGEELYLTPLTARLRTQQAPAEKMVRVFNQGGLPALVSEFTYR